PSTANRFSFTVTAAESPFAKGSQAYTVHINPAPTIGNLTVSQWTQGVAGFGSTLTVNGGTGALQLTSATGLPTGVQAVLSGNTIALSGAPSVAGSFTNGSLTVMAAISASVTKQPLSITINPPIRF